jgi:hypothetical protein
MPFQRATGLISKPQNDAPFPVSLRRNEKCKVKKGKKENRGNPVSGSFLFFGEVRPRSRPRLVNPGRVATGDSGLAFLFRSVLWCGFLPIRGMGVDLDFGRILLQSAAELCLILSLALAC